MLHELKKSEYNKIQHLFKELSFTLSNDAVINGVRSGRIYVDNVTDPKSVFVWAKPSEFFLVGNPGNDLFNLSVHKLLEEKIMPELLRNKIDFSVFYCSSDEWDDKLEFILRSHVIRKNYRWLCRFNQSTFRHKTEIPSELNVARIDELLIKKKLLNVKKVIDYISFHWNSIENYVQKGFGFCLLLNDVIVSWCISGNNVDKKCEMIIGTDERFRNRGFASILASVFLDYCITSNLTPIWQCGTENLPSMAVADKLGFKKELLYPVYVWSPNISDYFFWLLRNKPVALIPLAIQLSIAKL